MSPHRADDVVVPRTQVEQWIDMLDVVVSQTSGAARQASVQIQRQLKRLDKVVRGEIGGEEWTLPRRHNDGCECVGEAKCVEHFFAELDSPECTSP